MTIALNRTIRARKTARRTPWARSQPVGAIPMPVLPMRSTASIYGTYSPDGRFHATDSVRDTWLETQRVLAERSQWRTLLAAVGVAS